MVIFELTASAISDTRIVDQGNEDVFILMPEDRFFVLSTEINTHLSQNVSVRKAATALYNDFKKNTEGNVICTCIALFEAIKHANSVVYEMIHSDKMFRGMGVMLSCLYFHQKLPIFGHVGNNCIYQLREEWLYQLTENHLLPQVPLIPGKIKNSFSLLYDIEEIDMTKSMSEIWLPNFRIEDRSLDFPSYSNIVTKAIGTELTIEPQVNITSVRAGDRFLICTHYLSSLLCMEGIRTVLNHFPDNQEALEELVALAKKRDSRGGNTTAILITASSAHAV